MTKLQSIRTVGPQAPIPITYFEASIVFVNQSSKYGIQAKFSFIHRDPIDGECERITMIEPAHFIPAILWDTYARCAGCGEYDTEKHICPERD